MSEEPDVFGKLDSLISRHRSPNETAAPPAQPAASNGNGIPVLTEEVQEDALAVPVIPVLTEVVEKEAPKAEEDLPDWLTGKAAKAKEAPPSVTSESASSAVPAQDVAKPSAPPAVPATKQQPHSLAELERLLVLAVERRIAPRLAGVLDVALGELLEQFRQEIDRMVKEAVTEELLHHLESFANKQKTPPPA